MRFFNVRVCKWFGPLLLILLGLWIYFISSSSRKKPEENDNNSLVESFVFRENVKFKEDNIQAASPLFIDKNDNDYFVHLRNKHADSVTQQPLPQPRSHVLTNSSHVISQFVRQRGCSFKKKHGIIYQYLKIVIICSDDNLTTDFRCQRWIWDPANWTLMLTDNEEQFNVYGQYRVCSHPKISERVGKVIYSNGTEDYPDCTFNKTPCADVEPYFDWSLNMRINWSPCCRRMMTTMLSAAHDIFERYRIRYVMTGGAVISIARENGTLIPYDTDLDLIIDLRDREKFRNESAAEMGALGYYYIWDKRGSYIKICQNQACDAHIDVWFYERYPGDRHMVKYFKMRFWSLREGILFPTSWQTFEGKKYRFPRKIIKYLHHEYSQGLMAGYRNWKQVLLCNHKRGRKCTFYSDKKN